MKTKIRCIITAVLVMVVSSMLLPVFASAKYEDYWFKEKEPVTDYAYSMVFVPDTQIVLRNYPEDFHKIYDWILDNKEAKNIQYVIGLGDITDYDANDEWELAYEQITRMDGVVPYSLVIGNHDSLERYNRTFNKEPYASSHEGSYDGNIENTWRTIQIGDIPYLILTLDFLPDDEILEWANGVVEAHPNHNVIVATHAFLNIDGTPMSEGEGWHTTCDSRVRTNDADDIWEKFIRKHENIVLVVGGHIASDRVVVTQESGDHGNVVTEVLIDHQYVDEHQISAGMVCTFYFSEDGKDVTVETYSTVQEMYYMKENQFSLELEVVGDTAEDTRTIDPATGKPALRRINHSAASSDTDDAGKLQVPHFAQTEDAETTLTDPTSEPVQEQQANAVLSDDTVMSDAVSVGTQEQHVDKTPSGGQESSDIWLYIGGIAAVLVVAAVALLIMKKRKK